MSSKKTQRLAVIGGIIVMSVGGTVFAKGPGSGVPAQHQVAATWERDGNLKFKQPEAQRGYIESFAHRYFVTTSKNGQSTVHRSKRLEMRPGKRLVLTKVQVGNQVGQKALPVDAATVVQSTGMADILYNGRVGKNAQGKLVRFPVTPPMTILPYVDKQVQAAGKGVRVVQVRESHYKKNIAPRYLVTGLKPNAKGLAGLRVRLLLPSSSHDGRTVEGGRQNAIEYAKVDKFRIWQTDPSSSGYDKRQIKVLADSIPANGQLVTPVDLVVRLEKGKLFQMQMDPLPGKTAGPGGFYAGRTAEFQWVDSATFNKALQQ